jgi:hypothetical protein
MDGYRLDRLARAIGGRGTRRQALRTGIAAVAGLAAVRSLDASATLIPCQITCPPIVQVNDPGQCAAAVTFEILPNPGTTCTGIVCNQTSGSTFPVGQTSVHCNDIDGRADCDFTITVTDSEVPAITCPADVEVIGPEPQIGLFPDPTGSDNCPGVALVCDPPSGSFFHRGVTPVTCTATDASNNKISCAFNVTVRPESTATPTETATSEPTSTETETATAEPTSTATATATTESTIDPGTTTPEPTEVPATVAPTAIPGEPTATTAPVSQLPATGSGQSSDGDGKLMSLIAVGGGAALLARLGLRQRAAGSGRTSED